MYIFLIPFSWDFSWIFCPFSTIFPWIYCLFYSQFLPPVKICYHRLQPLPKSTTVYSATAFWIQSAAHHLCDENKGKNRLLKGWKSTPSSCYFLFKGCEGAGAEIQDMLPKMRHCPRDERGRERKSLATRARHRCPYQLVSDRSK